MTSSEAIDPVHTRELRLRGVARPRRATGELVPVRHGAYAGVEEWEGADARARYLAFLRATARGLAIPPLLSHGSAAAVLALPVLGRWRPKLEQTVPENAARSSRYVIKHRRQVLPEVVEVDGFHVTPAARTVVDLTSQRGFAAGVVAADHALRHEMCSREDLEREVELLGSGPGCRAAREAVAFADARAESAGESLSRARIAECGFEVPELQIEFWDHEGFVGRVDCFWPEAGLIGEFDGRFKYGRQDPGAPPSEEVVWQEKLREDRLRSLGFRVIRWTWPIALDERRFARHLRQHGVPALARRRPRPALTPSCSAAQRAQE